MTTAQTMQHDYDSIARNPTLGLVIMDHQSVAVWQMHRTLDRFVLWHSTRNEKRTDGLKMTIGKSAAGDKRRMV
jgi:hypothetical protein